jgi:hypothetical protein
VLALHRAGWVVTGSRASLERQAVTLTRAEVQAAFDGTELRLERLEAFRFEWTDAYRRQPFDEPPLGWLSVWTRRAPVPFVA